MHKNLVFFFGKNMLLLLKFDDNFQSFPQKVYLLNEYIQLRQNTTNFFKI
jgi:hypothetical protein